MPISVDLGQTHRHRLSRLNELRRITLYLLPKIFGIDAAKGAIDRRKPGAMGEQFRSPAFVLQQVGFAGGRKTTPPGRLTEANGQRIGSRAGY